jgi:hypothetical protein
MLTTNVPPSLSRAQVSRFLINLSRVTSPVFSSGSGRRAAGLTNKVLLSCKAQRQKLVRPAGQEVTP